MYSTEDILKELAAGRSSEDIANEFAKRLNAAAKQHKEKTLKEEKYNDFKNIMDAFHKYYSKYYPELATEMDEEFTREIFNEIENAMNLISAPKLKLTPKVDKMDALSRFLTKNNLQ